MSKVVRSIYTAEEVDNILLALAEEERRTPSDMICKIVEDHLRGLTPNQLKEIGMTREELEKPGKVHVN